MTDPRRTRRYREFRASMRTAALKRLDRCWICDGPIDYAAPAHSPDAWELDHVKSVRKHPELAYDPTNCESSHCSCNRSRGMDGEVMSLGNRKKRL